MNKRERTLLFTLLGLLIAVGAYAAFYFVYQKPMDAVNARIAKAKETIDQKNRELDNGLNEKQQIYLRNPHLKMWPKVSLPEIVVPAGKTKTADQAAKHLTQVQVDYAKYLSDLLRDNGFNPATLNIAPRPPDSKSSPPLPGKGPMYTKLEFNVTGTASLASVVKMMERFHQDPLLQEVKSITLEKPQTARKDVGGKPDDLSVNLTVEALLVTNAEPRAELKPSFPKKEDLALAGELHGGDRNYEDIVLKKNIFLGSRRLPGDTTSVPLTEDRNEVLREVRLTTVNMTKTGRWEAAFYDQGDGEKNEKGVFNEVPINNATIGEFTIKDRYKNKVMVGKVALIADRTVVFEYEGKYYLVHTGDYLIDAMKKPLKDAEIKELGLTPIAAKPDAEKKPDADKKVEAAKKPDADKKVEAEEPDPDSQ